MTDTDQQFSLITTESAPAALVTTHPAPSLVAGSANSLAAAVDGAPSIPSGDSSAAAAHPDCDECTATYTAGDESPEHTGHTIGWCHHAEEYHCLDCGTEVKIDWCLCCDEHERTDCPTVVAALDRAAARENRDAHLADGESMDAPAWILAGAGVPV